MTNHCVFCDRKMFEERLVVETESFNVIATLGQITNGGYVLIVPKNHVECAGAMNRAELSDLMSLMSVVRVLVEKEYGPAIVFEHGIVGQTIPHAPARIDLTEKIKKDFPDSATRILGEAGEIARLHRKKRAPYLLWESSDGDLYSCWNPPAPRQYLRIAAAELLGVPERADWKKMNPDLDRKLWSETVSRLKKYF
jgi:hypothetical protein